jgi:hypothetical protein
MVGFLLLIGAPVTCAIGIAFARRAELRFEQHRRKQLLTQAISELGSDLSIARVPNLSNRRLEMELLLLNLNTRAEILVEALSAETESGQRAIAEDNESSHSYFRRWQESRSAVQQAQEAYAEAIDEFHEFLHSLPPPLRAKAAERGAIALAINPA